MVVTLFLYLSMLPYRAPNHTPTPTGLKHVQ